MKSTTENHCFLNVSNDTKDKENNFNKEYNIDKYSSEKLLSNFYIKQNLKQISENCLSMKNDLKQMFFINSKGHREKLSHSIHLDYLNNFKYQYADENSNINEKEKYLDSAFNEDYSNPELFFNTTDLSKFKNGKDSLILRMASTRAHSVINNNDKKIIENNDANHKNNHTLNNNVKNNNKVLNYPKVYDYLIEDYPELKYEEEKQRISKYDANNEIVKITEVKNILIEKGKATEHLFCSSANKLNYNEIDNLSKKMNNLSIKLNKKFSKNDMNYSSSNNKMKFTIRKKRYISEKKVYSSYITFGDKEFKIFTDNDIGIDLYWQAPLEINTRKEDDDVDTDNEQMNLALTKIISDNAVFINNVLQDFRRKNKPTHRKIQTCLNSNYNNNLLNVSNNSINNYKEDFYNVAELQLFRGKITFNKIK